MRIARYRFEEEVSYGIVDGELVRQIAGTPFPGLASVEVTGEETGAQAPAEPMIFLKPSTSVIGPETMIQLPAQSQRVDYEAELAVVISRLCKDVPEDRVDDVVLGYTCANDVTARDLQARDGQWGRAKGFDTFCPLGPWIATDVDPDDLAIQCEVNEQIHQDASTSDMLFNVRHLVSWISSVMTLVPGDVILTGTPAGIGPLAVGDTVDVTIEDIGTLQNLVGDTGVFG